MKHFGIIDATNSISPWVTWGDFIKGYFRPIQPAGTLSIDFAKD